MGYPITLAAIQPGYIIIAFVIFVIGRWVINQIREANARAQQQAGMGSDDSLSANTKQEPENIFHSYKEKLTKALEANFDQESPDQEMEQAQTPPKESVSAREQFAQRAERLREKRAALGQQGERAAQQRPGQMSAPTQASGRMQEPRPLPTQTAKNLPTNLPNQRPAQANQPAVPKAQPKKPTQPRPKPQPAVSALPQSYEREHDEQQELQRARVAQAKSPQGTPASARGPAQAPNITRTVTAMDLRRAVMMREILDPPVSLRE